ncbi:hypothetical protein GQX74_003568 [Glossina fuscipes]|nr:hypothetical protein GQX74_003568 [Glossina fuscipes]
MPQTILITVIFEIKYASDHLNHGEILDKRVLDYSNLRLQYAPDYPCRCEILSQACYSPWKSSLPSSYKSSTGSSYSSRDDVSARFSALSSPSSYRPSFSGGTYRIKRDPPSVPASTYVSRYGSSITTTLNKPERDTSAREECSGSRTSSLKRYGSTASSLGRYSREPSPANLEHTNRLKSRDPSPVNRSLRGKSRDPSPAVDKKSKIGYSALNSFRSGSSRNTCVASYTGRYGNNNNANNVVRASVPSVPDKSISYLSSSDIKARTLSKTKDSSNRRSSETDVEVEPPPTSSRDCKDDAEIEEHEETDASHEEEEEKEIFITITVVNRATSPNPPGTSSAQRSRRMDIAKTIEKTIQRSTKKTVMLEKEIQSDRLDDSSRYSRFGLSGRASSSYSPHNDRYTSTSLRYSVSPLAITSRSSSSDNKKEDNSSSSCATNATTSASNSNNISNGNNTSSGKSTKSPLVKMKLSPPKALKLNSRQSSVENLSASASKPPVVPKNEYLAKCTNASTSSSSTSASKLPNKDFRKSALNVGPTDRPRKSRTPSSGTESDAQLNSVEVLNGALHVTQGLERSPSAGSEVSNASSRSARRTAPDSKLRLRSHNKPSTSSPPSRHSNNIISKQSCSKLSTGGTMPNVAIATSSSSGAESSSENKKPARKAAKKKHNKEGNLVVTVAESETSSDVAVIKSFNEKNLVAKSIANHTTQKVSKTESSSSVLTSSKSNNVSSSEKNPLRRLQKLSSVSNFFVAHQQDANSDEQIFVESSESSGGDADINAKQSNSVSENFETKTSTTKNDSLINYSSSQTTQEISCEKTNSSNKRKSSTKSKSKTNSSPCCLDASRINKTSTCMSPMEMQSESLTSYTTTTATTDSITDQEEPSWWQDTSRQIDTVSALDYNNIEEVGYKARHIESGERDWWLRNDEDDTLADDDLKTLNQQGDDDDDDNDEEGTDHLNSLPTTQSGNDKSALTKGDWWTNETTDETDEIAKHSDAEYKPHFYCDDKEERKSLPQNLAVPETECWDNNGIGKAINESLEQEDSMRLKLCSVGSGEKLWWTTEEYPEAVKPSHEIALEATTAASLKDQNVETSSSNSEPKRWWMAGPIKKLFNLQRVDSEEKAWWQDTSEKEAKYTKSKHNDSDEEEWWLDNSKKEQKQQKHQNETSQTSGSNNNHQSCSNGVSDVNVELSSSFNFEYSERPPPLGQCASPVEYREDTQQMPSLYPNIPMSKVQKVNNHQAHVIAKAQHKVNNRQNYDNSSKLFISRHQNIDELLGGSCRPLSPLFLDGSTFGVMPIQRNMFLEEITPDQVRIHDSTPQMPVIQIMDRVEYERDPHMVKTAITALQTPHYEQKKQFLFIGDSNVQQLQQAF